MPNPWALVILVVGGALIITGFKGSQDNLIAAITGKPYKNSVLSDGTTSPNSTTAAPSAYNLIPSSSHLTAT